MDQPSLLIGISLAIGCGLLTAVLQYLLSKRKKNDRPHNYHSTPPTDEMAGTVMRVCSKCGWVRLPIESTHCIQCGTRLPQWFFGRYVRHMALFVAVTVFAIWVLVTNTV